MRPARSLAQVHNCCCRPVTVTEEISPSPKRKSWYSFAALRSSSSSSTSCWCTSWEREDWRGYDSLGARVEYAPGWGWRRKGEGLGWTLSCPLRKSITNKTTHNSSCKVGTLINRAKLVDSAVPRTTDSAEARLVQKSHHQLSSTGSQAPGRTNARQCHEAPRSPRCISVVMAARAHTGPPHLAAREGLWKCVPCARRHKRPHADILNVCAKSPRSDVTAILSTLQAPNIQPCNFNPAASNPQNYIGHQVEVQPSTRINSTVHMKDWALKGWTPKPSCRLEEQARHWQPL